MTAAVPRETPDIGVGERAFIEALFPPLDRCHGRAIGAAHRSHANPAVFRKIPVGRYRQGCSCIGAFVLAERSDFEIPIRYFPYQRRFWEHLPPLFPPPSPPVLL